MILVIVWLPGSVNQRSLFNPAVIPIGWLVYPAIVLLGEWVLDPDSRSRYDQTDLAAGRRGRREPEIAVGTGHDRDRFGAAVDGELEELGLMLPVGVIWSISDCTPDEPSDCTVK